MKNAGYIYADPTGNITLLVEGITEKKDYKKTADMLMEREPSAEQVGFVSVSENEDTDIELNMAGGEFCGNATMSAAALFAKRKGLKKGTVRVRVSGAKEIIPVRVESLNEKDTEQEKDLTEYSQENLKEFACELNMPGVKSIKDAKDILGEDGKLVELDGITHLIKIRNRGSLNGAENSIRTYLDANEKAYYEVKIKEYCKILNAECMGIIFTDPLEMTINALVYVPGADTLFWENSCASGTVAAGAVFFSEKDCQMLNKLIFTHPGGKLSIKMSCDGKYYLGGKVRIIREEEI